MYRIIISERNKSHKTSIELSPSDELKVGDILLSDVGQVEVSSIEVDDTRVKNSIVEDIDTIWATSVEIPARIGFSVDLHGEVDSYKLDLERDFEIAPGDIVKIERYFNNNFYTEDNYVCKYDTNTVSFKFYYIVPKDITDVNKYAILGDGAALSDMGRGFTIEAIGNIWDNPELIEE